MTFEKCSCPKCDQRVEYPAEGRGQVIACPSCGHELVLTPSAQESSNRVASRTENLRSVEHEPSSQIVARAQKNIRLSQLDEQSIKSRTLKGDTPLHRAAKNGKIETIPQYLLRLELFMLQNDDGSTPIHIAAKHGCINQIPSEFLTSESLTVFDRRGWTPLHIAAVWRHASQFPKATLTPHLLAIVTQDRNRSSVLHLAASRNALDSLPQELISQQLLQLKDAHGETPLEVLRSHRATDKQIAYLHELGVKSDTSDLTKDRASELIDAALNERRRSQRPSKAQIEKLGRFGLTDELNEHSTMQDAHELLESISLDPPTEDQKATIRKAGFRLLHEVDLSAGGLDELLELGSQQPQAEDSEFVRGYGLKASDLDAFGMRVLVILIGHFQELHEEEDPFSKTNRDRIARACVAAMRDPSYAQLTITADEVFAGVTVIWPKSKLKEWFRAGR